MKRYRIVSLLLALITAAGIGTSCGSSDSGKSGTESASGGAVNSEASDTSDTEITTEADPFEGVDLGGTALRICTSINIADSDGGLSSNEYIQGPDEMTGERVKDVVYNRNLKTCEKLNCTVEYQQVDLGYDKVQGYVKKIVLAGEDAFELAINDQYGFANLTADGMFFNVLDTQNYESYFDFDSDGWYSGYMDGLTIGKNKRFLLAGDYFIDLLRAVHVIYFNKQIYENLYGDPNDLYSLVEDGGWTLEKYTQYVSGAYSDLNGDGTEDAGDVYGLYANTDSGMFTFCYLFSSDIKSVAFDSDGNPSINTINDRMNSFCDNLVKLYVDKSVCKSIKYGRDMFTSFTSGGALFTNFMKLGEIESTAFREMESLGILPYPKADDAQDGYHSAPHDTAELGGVPMTIATDKMSALSAFLQLITTKSCDELIPEYFDIALKDKYARDEPSGVMLDLIREGINSPFDIAYGSYFSSIIWRSLAASVMKGSNVLASSYDSMYEKASTGLGELAAKFE